MGRAYALVPERVAPCAVCGRQVEGVLYGTGERLCKRDADAWHRHWDEIAAQAPETGPLRLSAAFRVWWRGRFAAWVRKQQQEA